MSDAGFSKRVAGRIEQLEHEVRLLREELMRGGDGSPQQKAAIYSLLKARMALSSASFSLLLGDNDASAREV